MTCVEVHDYLFAFLDSELDAPLSIELQRHLNRCYECAREAEIERAIRKHLTRSLEAGYLTPTFDESSLTQLFSGSPKARTAPLSLRQHRRSMLAASIGIVFLAGLGIWLTRLGGDNGGAESSIFAELLVDDFEHILQESQPVQLACANAKEVSAWLEEQTGLRVSIAPMNSSRCKLIGGRKCRILGQPAAFAFYEVEKIPVSLVAISSKYADLKSLQRVEDHGQILWIDRCKGHTVVAQQHGELVYAAVSKLPEGKLIHFMTSAVHESD